MAKAPAKAGPARTKKPAPKKPRVKDPPPEANNEPPPVVHPDPRLAGQISMMVAFGTTQADIAGVLGISTKTLHEHYSDDLRLGTAKANLVAGGKIFAAVQRGEQWALQLWAARRMGWSEKRVNEFAGGLKVKTIALIAPDLPMPVEDDELDIGDDEDADEG